MSKKNIIIMLIVLGVVMALISLAADIIGIGNRAGFGWKQTSGTVVGSLVALIGIWLVVRKTGKL